jgi:hypothetical protein
MRDVPWWMWLWTAVGVAFWTVAFLIALHFITKAW